ncbi:DUF167 domain-containing protein [Candidatus Woesearchaeota archaeon]|nr:DUF167 domain-containing protein [Candidatus Woesearchaeota archaeon]
MQFPLKLKVKPNSKRTEILKEEGDEVVLAVKSPAENNKANIEILKFFAKEFKVKVKIIYGLKSGKKIIDKIE